MILTVLFVVAEFCLIIGCAVELSKLAQAKDDATKTLPSVTGLISAIVCIHAILWWIWFQYHPAHSHMYLIIMVSICMIVSFNAMALSLMKLS